MKWITNDDKGFYIENSIGISADEKRYYYQWRKQYVEGPPKATKKHTVAELKSMGLVGLYRRDNND